LKRWTAALVLVSCLFIAFNGVGESLQITLLGDCTMGGSLFNRVAKREGLAYFFSGLEHVLTTDDLTLANCEGVFTNRKTSVKGKSFILGGPPEFAEAFKLGSVEVVNTSNNHTYDYYAAGRRDTIAALANVGVGWFGDGDLYITEVNGIKIGMTGYTYPHRYDISRQTADIQTLREQGCNLVIVSMHWGKEASLKTNKEQRTLGPQLIDAGADIVFGHGPHVLQAIQIYKGKPIFYSLANFSFGANKAPKDPDTAALSLTYDWDENGLFLSGLQAVPCQMHENYNFRPYEVTAQEDRERIFAKLVFQQEKGLPDSGLPESFLTTGSALFTSREVRELQQNWEAFRGAQTNE